MDWREEMRILGTVQDVERSNSALKRKLSLLKRLGNVCSEDIMALRSAFICEDMDMFSSEMVSSLLSARVRSNEDVRNIVRVTSAFLQSKGFVELLLNEAWKEICSGIRGRERYWIVAYFYEIQKMAGCCIEREVISIEGLCNKMDTQSRALFVGYLLESYPTDTRLTMTNGFERSEDCREQVIGRYPWENSTGMSIQECNMMQSDVEEEKRRDVTGMGIYDYCETQSELRNQECNVMKQEVEGITCHVGDSVPQLEALSSLQISSAIESLPTFSSTTFPSALRCAPLVVCDRWSKVTVAMKGFLRYFFRTGVFRTDSELWKRLLGNKKTLLFVFLHPWEFEDIEFLASVAIEARIETMMQGIILNGVHVMYGYSKHKCIALVELCACLLSEQRDAKQIEIMEKILRIEKIDSFFRCRLAIILLRKMNMKVKKKYVPILKTLLNKEKSSELNIHLFNLCEEAGMNIS